MRRKDSPPPSRYEYLLVYPEYEGHKKGEEFTFAETSAKTSEGNVLLRRAKLIEHIVNSSTDPHTEWLDCYELHKGVAVRQRSIHTSQVRRWWKAKKSTPSHKAKQKQRKVDQ